MISHHERVARMIFSRMGHPVKTLHRKDVGVIQKQLPIATTRALVSQFCSVHCHKYVKTLGKMQDYVGRIKQAM